MKKVMITTLAAVVLSLSLSGCNNMSKRDAGTLAGAGLGAAAGYAVTGSPYGAVGGGVAGGFLGNQLAR